jgi:hypothetical protein
MASPEGGFRKMKSISILGKTFTPEFRAELGNASVVSNIVRSARTMGLETEHEGAAEIGWTFESAGGERGIYVQYSSERETPCELVVNGLTVQKNALFEVTHGLELVDWRYQCTVPLRAGENTLAIRSSGGLPCMYAVVIGDPPEMPQASVDDYFALLSQERLSEELKSPLVLKPESFSGLLKLAGTFAWDDAAIRKLAKIAHRAVRSVPNYAFNGQATIPWGGPLNGQRFRQLIFERLMRLGCDAIVETGTYLGTSTAFFARQGLPVHSCELRDEFLAAALLQLTAFDNISLYLMDSRAFLSHLSNDRRYDYKRPFFYLDAHWYEDLPLADEIRIIQGRWAEHIIMVDDFKVPEAGYTYDEYPNGLELTLDHLERKGVDLSQTAILFPTAYHKAETSTRRGTLVLMPMSLYQDRFRDERTMFRFVPARGEMRDIHERAALASASEA